MDENVSGELYFKNLEGFSDFNFTLLSQHERRGTSAMLRIKSEESKIACCLESILDVFEEIVFVDNASGDRTLEIALEIKERFDKEGKIKIFSYPFTIARCGSEHWETPENSIHSLVYYYNWSLSQCSCRYVCKWDGDMVMRQEARESFKKFLKQIQEESKKCWLLPGQTLYRDPVGNYYLAREEINAELRLFPYGFNPRYHKAEHWEILKSEPPLDQQRFEGLIFYELKFADEEEFSHWSTKDFPTPRKRREWENFQLIKEGKATEPRFAKVSPSFLAGHIPSLASSISP